MNISIKYKLLTIMLLGIIILCAVFYSYSVKTQQDNLNKITLDNIYSTKKTFYNLEKNDIKMLTAAMTDFMTNQEYKDIFMQNDRKKLYNISKDLYAIHRSLGITHFYYHRPNGTTFLRVHAPDLFDDRNTRPTFEKSQTTKGWSSGIELGKTALALRTVHPYYNGSTLIGYMEFGQEIDHFTKIMKQQTGYEYGTVVKKQYINATEWTTLRHNQGIPDNYNVLSNYVILDTTADESLFTEHCFKESDLDKTEDEGTIYNKFSVGNHIFVCGGFALYDANNTKVGTITVIQDVTEIESTAKNNNMRMLFTAIIASVLIGILIIFSIKKIIIEPLERMVSTATKIAGGNLDAQIELKSQDEFGKLAGCINDLKQIIVSASKDLEKMRSKKKKSKQ